MKITFIDDVAQAWRFASVWVQGLGAAAMTSWLAMPESYREALLSALGVTPERMIAAMALALFVSGILARVIKQDIPEVE